MLGAKPCTPAIPDPSMTNGWLGSGRARPDPSTSTRRRKGMFSPDTVPTRRPGLPPPASP